MIAASSENPSRSSMPNTISERLDELAEAGVDEFAAVTFDPSPEGRERTRALLRTKDK